MHAAPGFVPAPGDALTLRTLPTFFGVLELLLRAGVTTVAEAAFQDRVWRSGLESLAGLARIRIVHCTVDADLALARKLSRLAEQPLRWAHADPEPGDAAAHAAAHKTFERLSLDVPWIEVDTTDGYDPALKAITAFVDSPGEPPRLA